MNNKNLGPCCSESCPHQATHSVSGQKYCDGCYELVKALLDI